MKWVFGLVGAYVLVIGAYTVIRPAFFARMTLRYRKILQPSASVENGLRFARFGGAIGCFVGVMLLWGTLTGAAWLVGG
jgi:hypothetical protein